MLRSFLSLGFLLLMISPALGAKTLQLCPLMASSAPAASDVSRQNSDLLQNCINAANTGDIIEIKPGLYPLKKAVVIHREITLRTQGLAPNDVCADDRGTIVRCAHLVAISPLENLQRAFLQVQAMNVSFEQIFIDGNKINRTNSPEAQGCRNGNNGLGMNLHVNAANFSFLGSTTANALCGTGMEVAAVGLGLHVEKSWALNNGFHDQQMLWSDGITVLQSDSAKILNNKFIGNTDVDLIFGGCTNCLIQNNQMIHLDNFSQSSFAALMIHAWPKSTSGDYTKSKITENEIDCGNARCGFGILIGARPWYSAPTFGGLFTNNTVRGAQAGFLINDATGPITIGPNPIFNCGGKHNTSRGPMTLPAQGFSKNSKKYIHFINGAEFQLWNQNADFSGAIANWWK